MFVLALPRLQSSRRVRVIACYPRVGRIVNQSPPCTMYADEDVVRVTFSIDDDILWTMFSTQVVRSLPPFLFPGIILIEQVFVLFFCVSGACVIFCFWLSVPVQSVDWKYSSPKWPAMCRVGCEILLLTQLDCNCCSAAKVHSLLL